ncbi:MAG: sialate O-acetylesterase [Bryobacteraceae bacterium]|nr:sialate O-acetylesterase [Bryobacteraceae bacterium]
MAAFIRLPLLAAVFSLALSAQDITLTGLVNNQVIQRNDSMRADLRLGGSAAARANGKYIEARVLQDGAPVAGLDWTPLVRAAGGRWSGELRNVPAGGPYRVEVRASGVPGVAAVEDILVGDLWILAGQSNMQGVGNLIDVQQPLKQIHSFDMTDRWLVATEPLHSPRWAADSAYWSKNAQGQPERLAGDKIEQFMAERKQGAGLGLPFAVQMLTRTGVPIGLIPCAKGGSSMEEWDPALKSKGGESLYGALIRRVEAAGGKVRGVLWYQGEAETVGDRAGQYASRMERLVAALRADLKDPKLPFYYAQLGRFAGMADNRNNWNAIQEAQRLLEPKLGPGGMIATIDTALDDAIHIATPDLKRLGRRFATIVSKDLFPDAKESAGLKRGPRPRAAKLEGSMIRLSFDDVNGSLLAEGRASGFSIHAADGAPQSLIYKVVVDPEKPTDVLLYLGGKLPEKAALHYGYGRDPYCNLRDSADLAAPVFGPMAVQ